MTQFWYILLELLPYSSVSILCHIFYMLENNIFTVNIRLLCVIYIIFSVHILVLLVLQYCYAASERMI